jgi:hypothetical protein
MKSSEINDILENELIFITIRRAELYNCSYNLWSDCINEHHENKLIGSYGVFDYKLLNLIK